MDRAVTAWLTWPPPAEPDTTVSGSDAARHNKAWATPFTVAPCLVVGALFLTHCRILSAPSVAITCHLWQPAAMESLETLGAASGDPGASAALLTREQLLDLLAAHKPARYAVPGREPRIPFSQIIRLYDRCPCIRRLRRSPLGSLRREYLHIDDTCEGNRAPGAHLLARGARVFPHPRPKKRIASSVGLTPFSPRAWSPPVPFRFGHDLPGSHPRGVLPLPLLASMGQDSAAEPRLSAPWSPT